MTAYWNSVNVIRIDGLHIHKFSPYDLFCLGFVEDTYFVKWCHEHLFNVERLDREGHNLTVYVS